MDKVQQARTAYPQEVRPLEWSRLKFSDEAGVNLAVPRLYGRAPRGERVVGSVPLNYGKKITRMGAVSCQGLTALMTGAGATDGEVCRAYVRQGLCPTLSPGAMVVRDNRRAHKVSGVQEAIEQCGATLLYLPPYSPDLSPSELCWSKLKTALRTVGARTRRSLARAIMQARATICEADAMAWFAHCGYQLN